MVDILIWFLRKVGLTVFEKTGSVDLPVCG